MLKKYNQKRKFDKTPEPVGKKKSGTGGLKFVVHKHHASQLHYDFRLENRGVLLSWAVPKGPSLNPKDHHLAMAVEDHPYDYRTFEGTIPEGNYGAGTVMVWDYGTYGAVMGPKGEEAGRAESEKLIATGMRKGHITFNLHGKKLNGEFALVKIRGNKFGKGDAWLLIKAAKDKYAKNVDVLKQDKSAVTGRTMDQIEHAAHGKVWHSDKNHRAAKRTKMPHDIFPMLATLVDEPFDAKDWIFEVKLDGFRAVAEIKKSGGVEFYSRNGISFNETFAPVVESLKKIKHDVILDGEVVVLDKKGISRFGLLQNYRDTGAGKSNLAYFIFDILYLDGYDLREMPLFQRKELLAELMKGVKSKNLKFSEHVVSKGKKFFAAAKKKGLEGIIAKEGESEYVSRRSKSWLKIKAHMSQEAVIGGYTEPRGSRKGIGALILGVYNKKGELEYIGHTGGGLNEQNIKELLGKLKKITRKSSPFSDEFKTNAPATWVEPKLVCEVSFQEWTGDGHMRQPIFEGMRIDKKAKEVRREKAV